MVDDVESTSRIQAAALVQPIAAHAASNNPVTNYLQAITDAVVLSAQARQVVAQLTQGQTVAEAWLQHVTAPPDPTQPVTNTSDSNAAANGKDDKDAQAAMRSSMNRTMADLSWLFDAMSPPKVDTNAVAKVLADRMAADAVGTNPPLPQVIARAEQTGTVPVLYVENLSVTVGQGGTNASVDRVSLTTVDPSLTQGIANGDRPVVLDVGGEAKKVPSDMLLPFEKKQLEEEQRRALLIVRQGGNTLPQGTLHVKLDVLLPVG